MPRDSEPGWNRCSHGDPRSDVPVVHSSPSARHAPALRVRELLVLDPVRLLGVGADLFAALGDVGLVVAFEPADTAFAFEGEDMRRDAV